MNKYEQLIEHIINDDEAKARALFHDIVVEKSRDIYESLMDEEYTEEGIGGNQVQGLVDEITMDETNGIGEGDDEMDQEFSLDHEDGDELGGEMGDMGDMDGEQDLETKVMDLEAELEALKAEFEQLMGDESGDDEGDMEMGDDEGSEDEESGDENMFEASDEEEEEMTEAKEEDEEEMTESRQASRRNMSAVDIMREYVEKISAPSNTEFTPVGTGAGGDKAAGNTKNPLAGKNDMGGSSANIAKGGSEQAPDGTTPKGKVDGNLVKNAQEIDVAKRNVNKPGGNKGAQDFYGTKAKAKTAEEGGINKSSIETGGN